MTAEAASVSPPSAEEGADAEPSSTEGNMPKVHAAAEAEAEAGPSSSAPAERVADEDRWFRDGDVVVGRVTWANARGARVELLAEPRLTGCATCALLAEHLLFVRLNCSFCVKHRDVFRRLNATELNR